MGLTLQGGSIQGGGTTTWKNVEVKITQNLEGKILLGGGGALVKGQSPCDTRVLHLSVSTDPHRERTC